MEKKVVFLDVDGTVINEQGIIPQSAQDAIKKAISNGHKLVVCSGRSFGQIPKILSQLGFCAMITGSGAQVIADGKEIFHAVIDEKHRKWISEYMEKHEIDYAFQTQEGMILSEHSKNAISSMMLSKGMTQEQLQQLVGECHVQENVWDNEKEEKLVYVHAPFDLKTVQKDLQPYFDVVALSFGSLDESCGEVSISGIHKAVGMEKYLAYAGISRENSIGIGDGANDLQMLEYAGIGVAMGNADEEVKKHADMVTAHIDEDGLFRAFETLGLLEG